MMVQSPLHKMFIGRLRSREQVFTDATGESPATLAAGSSYPPLTLTVSVANTAPASVTNTAAVAGGGEANTANDSATDVTAIVPVADLVIAISHTGSFRWTIATGEIPALNSSIAGSISGTIRKRDLANW